MASVDKHIRQVKETIEKCSGRKRARFESKLAFLEGLPKNAYFVKGAKIQGQSGWQTR